jgi:FkbM family methyltransferase
MYRAYLNLRRRLSAASDRSMVRMVCAEYGLRLDPPSPRDAAVFKEVFIGKAYADGFPFYRAATVVDIGAHHGFFTLFAARNLAADARIVSVEPARDNLRVLRANVALNGLGSMIHVVEAAVAGEDGEAFLFADAPENRSILPAGRAAGEAANGERVATLSLESLFRREGLARVDFLKMDCEGAEYDALRAAPDAVLAAIRCISLEFHDLKRPEATGWELAAHLRSKGFTIARCVHENTSRNLNTGKLLAFRE